MEEATCECYWVIRRAFDIFLGNAEPPGPGSTIGAAA
jgi:hypothetical protein